MVKYMFPYGAFFILVILPILFTSSLEQIYFDKAEAQVQKQQQQQILNPIQQSRCVRYDSSKMMIIITCKSATLTDIYNQLNNPVVLNKQPNGVWSLNANITINPNAKLTIDPTDTTWLKIITDEKSLAYGIHIKGSFVIDRVKVSSWNPFTNNFAMNPGSRESSGPATKVCGSNCPIQIKDLLTHHGAPRPFIMIEPKATGTTNITNSYIGYLGYEAGWGKKAEGIHYNGGDGSVVRNNNIDHVYFGFYSVGVGNMLIENNIIHDSGHYGIDPHTGTHDMIIRNNTVYNNNGTAIICSLDCYNIVFENNKIYNNNGAGISFSRNTNNSIARNNIIDHQITPIELTSSHNDEIYNNLITNTDTPAISIKANSTNNKIFYNTIKNATMAIKIEPTSKNNLIYSNNIINTPSQFKNPNSGNTAAAYNSNLYTTGENAAKESQKHTGETTTTNTNPNAATVTTSSIDGIDNHQSNNQIIKKHLQQQQPSQPLEPDIPLPHSLPTF